MNNRPPTNRPAKRCVASARGFPYLNIVTRMPLRARQRFDHEEGGTIVGDVGVPRVVEFVDHTTVVDDLQFALPAPFP